jgi:hypothetical protein
MRRVVLPLVAALGMAGAAHAAPAPDVIRVAKPSFPPPLARVAPSAGARLQLVSATSREPDITYSESILVPRGLPYVLAGLRVERSFIQPGTSLVQYGPHLVASFGPTGRLRYAFDFRSFGFPPKSLAPRAYGPQEVVWARQLDRTLVLQTAHLGYASDSGGRNGYLTGIDVDTGRVTWRSPSLVANARNFVVTQGLIVSGYGFTAEKDWLYLVDPRTGRVRHRLALPSMAEQIAVRGERIVVRCYDAHVVVQLSD